MSNKGVSLADQFYLKPIKTGKPTIHGMNGQTSGKTPT